MSNFDNIILPRLVTGSHEGGTGRGCAMNLLSFIQGDSVITDYPECSAAPLARMVQATNDILGEQNGEPFWVEGHPNVHFVGVTPKRKYEYLTPEDSVAVLELAWSTVGTAGADAASVATWAKRVLSNAHAVVDEAQILSDDVLESAWAKISDAVEEEYIGERIGFVVSISQAIYVAVGTEGLVVFVQDAIDLWKSLNDVSDVVANPVVVNEAIAKMAVSV